MTLENLTTPFERRRMIEFGKDNNKAVRHWYNVQQVSGPLYKSEETVNEYREKQFNLYIIFPETDTGLLYRRMSHPDWYTVEKMMEALKRDGCDTAEHMIAVLDRDMAENRFIPNTCIDFVQQFDPERAARYAQYRLEYYARRAEEGRAQAEARQALEQKKAEEEAARKQAALEAEKAKYFGWLDNVSHLRFGRITSFMNRRIRVDGEIMTKRDFVIKLLNSGWTPKKDEGVTSAYGSRWEPKISKPRTIYMLIQGSLGYTISKTEYDFAVYLFEHS